MASLRHGYAQVNGIRLHYAESGSGDDLVILLHGFPEFSYCWRHQLEALSERYHVVAPDMRGYNLSDKPSAVEAYRIDILVADVLALIEFFGAQRAAIVAHDWGANVAWALAQKYPERVSSLVALQVPPAAAWWANFTLKQLVRSWYMFFFQLPVLPEWAIRRNDYAALERVLRRTIDCQGAFSAEDIEIYKTALRRPGALTAAINYYRANLGHMMLRALRKNMRVRPKSNGKPHRPGRIRVPTLFVFGERDFAILPATVREVSRYIDAPYREVRIPASGHWVQNEAVDEVNKALLEFLGSNFGPAS